MADPTRRGVKSGGRFKFGFFVFSIFPSSLNSSFKTSSRMQKGEGIFSNEYGKQGKWMNWPDGHEFRFANELCFAHELS